MTHKKKVLGTTQKKRPTTAALLEGSQRAGHGKRLVLDIVQDVYRRKITRIEAATALLALTVNQNKHVVQIILCIKRLAEDLLEEVQTNSIKEFELCSRYLQVALQPLFDDSTNNVLFRWTNTISSESRKTNFKTSKKSPDGCISITEEANVGFAEVKTADGRSSHYEINFGLYRLAVFSKNAIDTNKLLDTLGIQAVGNCITFYITQLKGDSLYLMIELDHLKFPLSLNELPQLLGCVDSLFDILHAFEKICLQPKDSARSESLDRETIGSPILRPFVEKTANRNRLNYHPPI